MDKMEKDKYIIVKKDIYDTMGRLLVAEGENINLNTCEKIRKNFDI